jgi:hypothetical protein
MLTQAEKKRLHAAIEAAGDIETLCGQIGLHKSALKNLLAGQPVRGVTESLVKLWLDKVAV